MSSNFEEFLTKAKELADKLDIEYTVGDNNSSITFTDKEAIGANWCDIFDILNGRTTIPYLYDGDKVHYKVFESIQFMGSYSKKYFEISTGIFYIVARKGLNGEPISINHSGTPTPVLKLIYAADFKKIYPEYCHVLNASDQWENVNVWDDINLTKLADKFTSYQIDCIRYLVNRAISIKRNRTSQFSPCIL